MKVGKNKVIQYFVFPGEYNEGREKQSNSIFCRAEIIMINHGIKV